MYVGVCRVSLHLPENHSLKGKRQVLKSIIQRLRNEFNVAVAEVEENDLWQSAVLGICCVSNEAAHADEMLARAVTAVERNQWGALVTDFSTEIIPV